LMVMNILRYRVFSCRPRAYSKKLISIAIVRKAQTSRSLSV
jgi:hypothetical protein